MRKPSRLVIFLTVFIDLIGFGIVLPLLPKYSERFGAHGFEIGMIISSFSLMQFFFSPVWGRLSDRIGRRPVLLIGNAGSAVSYALFGLAGSSSLSTSMALTILVLSRVFAGICGATLSVASAYIADITTRENRSKGMGLIGMAFGLGFILGPAIGGFSAAKFGLTGPGYVAAALCAGNFLLACVILGESRKPGTEAAAQRPRIEQWLHTVRQPKVGLLIGLFFLATLTFTCFESTLPLLLDKQFHFGEKNIGYLFAYCGLIGAFIQGGAIGKMVKSLGEEKLIFMSLFVVSISLFMIPYVPQLSWLLLALGLFAAGSGVNRAPTMGLISLHSPQNEQGTTFGVAQSAGTLARIIGPVMATGLYGKHAPLPYLVSGTIAAIAGITAWRFLGGKSASNS